MAQNKLSRRDFLRISAVAVGGAALASCGAVAPSAAPVAESTAAPGGEAAATAAPAGEAAVPTEPACRRPSSGWSGAVTGCAEVKGPSSSVRKANVSLYGAGCGAEGGWATAEGLSSGRRGRRRRRARRRARPARARPQRRRQHWPGTGREGRR